MKTFLIFACLATCVFAVDYCNIAGSRKGMHIGCGNDGKLSKKCPKGSKEVKFSQKHINIIVAGHNEKRNEIAGGKISGYKPAAKMATMVWDPELARVASFNANRCVYGHDRYRMTEKFRYSGQNIYMGYGSHPIGDPTFWIQQATDLWFKEHMNGTMADIDKLPVDFSAIGHFTVMVRDTNVAVGCGAVTMPSNEYPGNDEMLLVCNYAANNMYGQQVYKSSENAASGCKTTIKPYLNLCPAIKT